jgi:hypothetical protein
MYRTSQWNEQIDRLQDWTRRFGDKTGLNSVGLVALMGTQLTALVCWFILFRWYSLADYVYVPFFALDKIDGHFESPQIRATLVLFLLLSLTYVMGAVLLRQAPVISPALKATILVFVVIAAVLNVFIYPIAAIDLIYYVVVTKLTFFYQENPYLVTFAPAYQADPWAAYSAFLNVRLVYGPVWLFLSWLPLSMTGYESLYHALVGYKVYSLFFFLLAGGLIYAYVEGDKARWLAVYLFLANPLLLFESIANGHNDVMVAAFLLAAVLALKRRSWLVGPLLAVATLIKLLAAPLAYVFAWQMWRDKWGWRDLLLAGSTATLVTLASVAPFWAGGRFVGGKLQAISTQQEIMRTSSLYSLSHEFLQHAQEPEGTFFLIRVFFLAAFAFMTLISVRHFAEFEQNLAYILLLFVLLVSSFFAWYLIPVMALLVLRSDRISRVYLYWATLFGLIFYTFSVWAWFNSGLTPFQVRSYAAMYTVLPVIGFILFQWQRQRRLKRNREAPPSKA